MTVYTGGYLIYHLLEVRDLLLETIGGLPTPPMSYQIVSHSLSYAARRNREFLLRTR